MPDASTNPIVIARGSQHFYWCPGCDHLHSITVGGDGWTFTGTLECPTYAPSQLTTGGGDNRRCHTFIRAGQIQFLNDCTHALKGQTVPLPPVPDWVVRDLTEQEQSDG